MTLGERIKTCRQNADLSQEQVAELVGVSRQAVTKWETNKSAPSTENLFKLAEIFETTVDMILVEKKEANKKICWRARLRFSLLMIAGYFLFYLFGRIVWVPMKDMTVMGWLTTRSPYDINEYLYGWLFDNNFIWYGMLIAVAFSLLGKFKAAFISYAGFVLGYILGYLLGPNPEGAAMGQGHYGWAIWGVTFLISIVIGFVVEKCKKTQC